MTVSRARDGERPAQRGGSAAGREAGGAQRSFGSVVGERKNWVRDPDIPRDPNERI